MEEIIITGATGFIGRNLIKEIVNVVPKEKILCLIKDQLDELEISGRKILEDLKIKTKEIDLPSGRGLDNLPETVKTVIHLAASTESGDADHSCNDIGMKNFLNALSPMSSDINFIFTSTAAIYSGRNDFDKPIDKNTKPNTSNEYGRSKVRAEEILLQYSSKYGFNSTILRLATVWGEGTRKDGLFDAMRKLIIKKSIIPKLNWPGRTSLIHVNDVIKIIIFIARNRPRNLSQIYVLSHEGLTLSDISKILHRNLNIPYKSFDMPGFFWNTSKKLVYRSYLLDNFLPSKTYNTFWRLNLILNDSLYCEPDEIIRLLPDMKITMQNFIEFKH